MNIRFQIGWTAGLLMGISIFLLASPAHARQPGDPWIDINEELHDYYGSEAELKMSVRTPIVSIEDWRKNYSVSIPGLFRYTDYPRFSSTRILFPPAPIYYSFESKIDDRTESWLFPFFYSSHDGDLNQLFTPLGYQTGGDNFADFSLLYLYYQGYDDREGSFYSTLFPFYYFEDYESDQYEGSFFTVPLLLSFYKDDYFPEEKTGSSLFVSLLGFYHHEYGPENDSTTMGFPILPLLFYLSDDKTETHVNVLTLFDSTWKNGGLDRLFFLLFAYQAGDDGYTNLFPFYFHDHSPDGHRVVFPLFWSRKGDDGYAHLFPFFYSGRSSSGDFYHTFLPLYYYEEEKGYSTFLSLPYSYSEDETGTRYNSFLLADWHNNNDEETDRFFFHPLVYYKQNSYLNIAGVFWNKPGPDGYTHVLPLFYSARKSNGDFYNTFIPFYYSEQTDGYSTFLSLPYSYSEDETGTRYNSFLLADWHNNNDEETDRFFFHPLVYYKQNSYLNIAGVFWNKPGPDGYTHVFPLFYSARKSNGDFYNTFIPFYYSEQTDGYSTFISLPYSYSEDETGTHYNSFLLADWHNNNDEETDRFFFHPLVYYKQNSYLNIAGVFWNKPGPNGYTHVLPFFYSARYPNGNYYHSFFPAYYFEQTDGYSTLVSLPYSYSESETGTHYNSFLLADWHNNPEGETDRFFFYPLVFYKQNSYLNIAGLLWNKPGPNGYTHVLPLYYSAWRPNGDSYSTLIPFYYYEKIGGFSKLLSLPYSYSESKTGTHYNSFLLADWHINPEGETERFFFFPLFYYRHNSYLAAIPFYLGLTGEDYDFSISPVHLYYEDDEVEFLSAGYLYLFREDKTNGNGFQHVFPLYYSWWGEESRGRILAPVYFSYADKYRNMEFSLGLLQSSSAGSFLPGFRPGFGTDEQGRRSLYLETEISFGYNLFRIKDKTTFYSEETDDSLENVEQIVESGDLELDQETDPETDRLFAEDPFSIDKARQYFEISMLFGAFDYVHADSKKHLRVLPLAWVSWDEENDDHVHLFPPFLPLYFSYASGDEETTFVFPFYGYQQSGASYIESILLNGYVHQFDGETTEESWSVLWPLLRYRESVSGSSFRFLPFFYYGSDDQDCEDHTRSILFPVYYVSFTRDSCTPDRHLNSRFMVLGPTFHRYTDNDNEMRSLTITPGLPVVINRIKEDRSGDQIHRESWTIAPPLFYHGSEKIGDDRETSLTITPFFYIREKKYPEEGTGRPIADTTGILYLPFLYKRTHTDFYHTNFMFLMDWKYNRREDSLERLVLFPFMGIFNTFEENRNRRVFLSPFLYHSDEKIKGTGEHSALTLSPLYSSGSYVNKPDRSGNVRRNSWWVTPWILSGKDSLTSLSGLITDASSWWILTVPFIYRSEDTHSAHTNVMGLFDMEYDRRKDRLAHLMALPFFSVYHTYESDRKRDTWIAPGFYESREARRGGKSSELTLTPVYWSGAGTVPYNRNGNTTVSSWWAIPGAMSSKEAEISSEGLVVDASSWWATIVPFIYRSEDTHSAHTNVMGLFDMEYDRREDRLAHLMALPFFSVYHTYESDRKRDTWIAPGFYESREARRGGKSSELTLTPVYWSGAGTVPYNRNGNTTVSSWWAIPGAMSSKESEISSKGLVIDASSWWATIVPFIYRSEDTRSAHTNVMGLFDMEYDRREDRLAHLMALPFFSVYHTEDQNRYRSTWVTPLAYHSREVNLGNGEYSSLTLSPLYWRGRFRDRRPFASGYRSVDWWASWHGFRIQTSEDKSMRNMATNSDRTFILPGLTYRSNTSTTMDDMEIHGESNTVVAGVVWVDNERFDGNSWNRRHVNAFGIFDYVYNSKIDSLERLVLGPFWYTYDPGENLTGYNLFPFHFSRHSSEGWWSFTSGLYLRKDSRGDRQNFLFLFDREYVTVGDQLKLGLLFHSIYFEDTPDYSQFDLAYGALFHLKNFKDSDDYDFHALLHAFYLSEENGKLTNGFFPFYHYSDNGTEETILVPTLPVLYYSYSRPGRKLELAGLGSIWYRNYHARERRDLQLVLGGLAYEKKMRPERGYHQEGVVWGAVWNSEYEEETGYEHVDVLDFVYSRTTIRGETTERIFGIRI